MEGNMKIHSLNVLKKYCSRGTWLFLSAKFPPPSFSSGHDLEVIRFTHIQHGACFVLSLPFPLPLSSLHLLFCSLHTRNTESLVSFPRGATVKTNLVSRILCFMCPHLNLKGQSLVCGQNSEIALRTLIWSVLMGRVVKITFGHTSPC